MTGKEAWNIIQPYEDAKIGVREFEEIVVEYPPEDLCTYPEYKGKPYFGIQYRENGENIVGYGTYNPQVLSQYLKDYFISTTKNDLGELDCISRKAVIDELKRYFHDEYYQRTSIQDCRDCFIEDVLNHLPAVTPQEPRKGHWIVREDNTSFVKQLPRRWVECSHCGWSFSYDRIRDDYCSNCGADMRGEE